MELTPKKFVSYLKRQRPGIVLFYGPEYSLIKRALNKLIEAWDVRDGLRDFSGRELGFDRFSEELVSKLLFSPRKMIVVREAFQFFKGLKAEERKALSALLKSVDRDTCVVFVESSDVDSRYRRHPLVSLVDGLGVVVLCRKAEEREIRSWLKRKLEKRGIYDDEFVDFLVSISGGSFDVLEKELEKLLISFDKKVVSGTKVYSPFSFIELALTGSPEAFDALDYLFSSGFNPVFLLVLFQNAVRKTIAVKKNMGVKPYERRRYGEYCARLSERDLVYVLEKLFEVELRLKTTGMSPKLVWEDFLFSLRLGLKPDRRNKAGQTF
ncbi:MAG: hypothetical protein GXO44_01230 [Deferribacteres bacterium]|nr:hypothetical protein [Deferribacteres bacterium]